MQKKFLHENFLNSENAFWKFHRALSKAVSYNVGLAPLGQMTPGALYKGFSDEGYSTEEAHKSQAALGDQAAINLALIGHWIRRETVQPYVFAEDFLKVLMKAKIKEISWNMIPDDFIATFRFPTPILDPDGDPISEVLVAIKPRSEVEKIRNGKLPEPAESGSRVLLVWWRIENVANGFICQILPDGDGPIFPESFNTGYTTDFKKFPGKYIIVDDIGKHEHTKSIMKALIYVCSGNPDLRDEKNQLSYKSKGNLTSSAPIKAHREFSGLVFKAVGYGWLKDPNYSAESWGVEPHMRYQPYGPGRSQYKWILIPEHNRSRRKELDARESGSPNGDETESEEFCAPKEDKGEDEDN